MTTGAGITSDLPHRREARLPMNAPTSPQPQPMRRRRWHWLAALAVVVLLGPAQAAATIRTPRRGAVAQELPVASPSPPPPASVRERLRRLAATITAVPADSATGDAYHHQRRWILDTTGTPAPSRPNTPAVVAVDIRRWEAGDGSGLGIEIEVGPDFTLAGASPGHRSTDAEFANGRTTRHTYPPGHRRSPITGPLASDPAELARQLATFGPRPDSPPSTLRGVDELYTSHYVPLPVRRAVLELLADIGGLSYRDGAIDRLGRTGVAVSLTNHGIDYTLILDPTTGHLLVSEQRSTGAHEYLDVPHGLVRYYTLFVEQGRRPRPS